MSKRADSIFLKLPTIESILGCRCTGVICLAQGVVVLQFPRNTFSCMERSIVVARMFNPRVREIRIYSDHTPSTFYFREAAGWVAKEVKVVKEPDAREGWQPERPIEEVLRELKRIERREAAQKRSRKRGYGR